MVGGPKCSCITEGGTRAASKGTWPCVVPVLEKQDGQQSVKFTFQIGLWCYLQCVIGCSPVLVLVNAGVELVQHLAVMDRAGLDGVVLVVVAALSRNVVSPQGARGQIMSGVIGWVNILMADVALSGDVIASQVVRSQVVSAVAGCADVLMTDVTLDRNFILPQVLVAQAMVGSTNVVLVGIVDGTSSGCAMALVRDIVMNRSIMSPQVVRG